MKSDDRHAPLVSPEVDLRNFTFMPLDVLRLRDSDLAAIASGDAFRAAVLLWCAAWHQVPAATLPNDDRALARLAGYGRSVTEWEAVKEEALRGFILCSDDRLHHPVVAEKAIEAWRQKRQQLERTEAATAARLAKQQARRDVGRDVDRNEERHVERNEDQGRGEDRTGIVSSPLRFEDTRAEASPAEKPAPKPKPLRQHPFPPDAFARWYDAYPHKIGRAAAEKAFAKVRASDTISFDELLSAIARYRQTKPPDREWCNPATWLNQGRWADEPASSAGPFGGPSTTTGKPEPRIDLGGGVTAPHSAIRSFWSRGRWDDQWGPDPNHPGCRIPPATLSTIMGEAA